MATEHDDDCYHRAEDGEARFTLLARDPLAPSLVRQWARDAKALGLQEPERLAEARRCADAMEFWREKNRPHKQNAAVLIGKLDAARAELERCAVTLAEVGPENAEIWPRLEKATQGYLRAVEAVLVPAPVRYPYAEEPDADA